MLSLYSCSLCFALALLLFFGFDMLFARVPEKMIYSRFIQSRKMMERLCSFLLPAMLCTSFLT